ncbi:MAG: hypothetical protein NTX50_26810 [Candidatus Sumerlaeota bacterium]|nr:hypothetical protein [Candidatus Sumerlaeota bacterium]
MRVSAIAMRKGLAWAAMSAIAIHFSVAAFAQMQPANPKPIAPGKPAARPAPAKNAATPQIKTLSLSEIPAPIKDAINKSAPDYTISDGTKRPDEARYFLRLASGVRKALANVTVTTAGVAGSIDAALALSDVPTTLVESFKKIVPTGSVHNARETIAVGGAHSGALTYYWESPTSASIAAVAAPAGAPYQRSARPTMVMAAADGSLMEVTERIETTALPRAVSDAVTKTFPQGEIRRLNRITTNNQITANNQITFSFEVRTTSSRAMVQTAADGNLKYETQTYTPPTMQPRPNAPAAQPAIRLNPNMTPTGF